MSFHSHFRPGLAGSAGESNLCTPDLNNWANKQNNIRNEIICTVPENTHTPPPRKSIEMKRWGGGPIKITLGKSI